MSTEKHHPITDHKLVYAQSVFSTHTLYHLKEGCYPLYCNNHYYWTSPVNCNKREFRKRQAIINMHSKHNITGFIMKQDKTVKSYKLFVDRKK